MKSQDVKTFTLKTKSGTEIPIPCSREENDIDIFIHEVMVRSGLTIFMDLILEKNDLLKIFTNHRDFFHSKSFEHRAVLSTKSNDINSKALQMIKKSHEVKFKNELTPHLDQLVKFLTLVGSAGIKTVVQKLNDEQIRKLRKTSIFDIAKGLEKGEIKFDLTDEVKQTLKKESEKIFVKNIDMYMMSSLFPLISVELIEGQRSSDFGLEVFSEIEKTGVGFPIFSVYICNNVEYHDYEKPPFVAVLFPSMKTPSAIECPNCGHQTKVVKFFSFIPEVSKRIMGGDGFYPYIVAYRMQKEGINFSANIVNSKINQTDFLIRDGNAQFYAEVKCYNREDTITSMPGNLRIASKLINAITQMDTNSTKWAEQKDIQFNKKFVLTNYNQEDIDQIIRENDNLRKKIKRNDKILGYDQLDLFVKEIKTD